MYICKGLSVTREIQGAIAKSGHDPTLGDRQRLDRSTAVCEFWQDTECGHCGWREVPHWLWMRFTSNENNGARTGIGH
jgi:hypothetical protein